MSNLAIPNQNIILDPYETPIFDYDNHSSKLFLSENINQLTIPFGNNIIRNGFLLNDYNMSDDYIISVEIGKGMCIIDNTIIEYKENVNLDIDCSDYDQEGFFIISISYNSARIGYRNLSKIGIYYINLDNETDDFFIQQENIILYKFTFDKGTKEISKSNLNSVNINSKNYEIYPLDDHKKEFHKIIKSIFH